MLADAAAAALATKRRRVIPFVICVSPFNGRRRQCLAGTRFKARTAVPSALSLPPAPSVRKSIHAWGWPECVALDGATRTGPPPPPNRRQPRWCDRRLPLWAGSGAAAGGEAVEVVGGLGQARAEGVDEAREPFEQGPVAGVGGGEPLARSLGPARECRQVDTHGPAVLPHHFAGDHNRADRAAVLRVGHLAGRGTVGDPVDVRDV